MNKLFKYFLCIITIIWCQFLFAAGSSNKATLLIKLIPQKDTYYVGETAELRIELALNQENEELNEININGLNDFDYASFSQLHSKNPQTTIFSRPISFYEPNDITLEISADYTTIYRKFKLGFHYQETNNKIYHTNAKPLKFKVLPLPEHNGDFSGIIGIATINTTISKNTALLGDIITLKSTVLTSFPMKQEPVASDIKHIDGFKLYPAKITQIKQSDTTTSYTIEQTIVPNKLGEFTIPAPSISYFDTADGTYKSISEEKPLKISIVERKSNNVEDVVVVPLTGNKDEEISLPNSEASPLKLDFNSNLFKTKINFSAKLAPADTALTIFEIPANSSISILEQHGTWCRIAFNNYYGWISLSAIEMGEK